MAFTRSIPYLVASAAAGVGVLLFPSPPKEEGDAWGHAAEAGSCPTGMVSIRDKFCIDRYEAYTVEVDANKTSRHNPQVVRKHSPFKPIGGAIVMAKSGKGKIPQGHISRNEAERACWNAGKRLCTDEEWLEACRGKKPTKYPYGDTRESGKCNDRGVSGFNLLFGPGNNTPPDAGFYTKENMNDPRLNQIEGTVAKTGSFGSCKNAYKIYDMVGNLHEWTSAKEGTFRGGYYLDTSINGEGCDYRTTAHDGKYFDYSTGFRCCFGGAEQDRIAAMHKQAEKDAKAKRQKEREASKKKAKDKKAGGTATASATKKKKKKDKPAKDGKSSKVASK